MQRLIYLFVFLFSFQLLNAQVTYKSFQSSKLGEERQLKVQLPRGYEGSNKSYPLIIVFDGDYLFEVVAGNVDYYSYWDDMPEAIVVGVNQLDSRDNDTYYSEQNSLPIETGASFHDFVSMELLPYLDKLYRTENFRIAVGHGKTANFINYFMFNERTLFQSYIVLSPDLAPGMTGFLTQKIPEIESKTFYYLATSSNDVKRIKSSTEALNTAISSIENNNVFRSFDNFEGPSHYSMPAHAIPKALESIFLVFQPISKKEYKETILKLETSPVDYLTEKYQMIEDLFGIQKPILVNDFRAIAAAIKKKEKFELYEELGKIARKEYPNTLLGHYYLARFYEETGKPKKAMKTYQSAYVLDEIGGLTKDLMIELSDQIKVDFGY